MEEKIFYEINDVKDSKYTPLELDYLLIVLSEGEERSRSALIELLEKGICISNLIVAKIPSSGVKLEEIIESELLKKVKNIRYLFCEGLSDEELFASIRNEMCTNLKDKQIGLDISCMAIPLFFLLLKWFAKSEIKLFVYYTEPQRYIMNGGLFKSYFSTEGPVTIKEIMGYPGISVNGDNFDRILFCILGFDNDLLPHVIQEAVPSKIVAINGFPSFYPKFKDISLANNEKVLSGSEAEKLESGSDLTKYVYVEADNPFDAYNTLQRLSERFNEYCIDIVPLGSKPMALGVCLFAVENSNVRVLYPFPEKYASATGRKSKKTLEYVLEFNDLDEFL